MKIKNITFVIRCTPERAIQILNRMHGTGEITKEYCDTRIREIDSQIADTMAVEEMKKQKRMDKFLRKPKRFYKKHLK